jgi:hypothetical protein
LESVETPQQGNRLSDTDSAAFVAVYRFRDSHTPKTESPMSVKFQVNRSRVAELRSHLESQPEVVCAPDNDLHYQVRLKPLPDPLPGTTPAPAAATQPSPALDERSSPY